MYRSANVSAGRAGGRRWAQQHPPPAGARSADARAPPQVLLRSWSRLTRAPSYATPSRPDRTNCRKAFHWPHRPASSWYHFSWRNLHRRANADSLFGTNVEITPPSISNHFCYGTLSKAPPEKPKDRDRKVIGWSTSGPLYADEITGDRNESTVRVALQEIADAQGDVDAFIAQQSEKARTVPRVASEIARRLLEVGRAKEAWSAINAVNESRPGWIPFEWEEIRLNVMEALGNKDEAQVFHWQCFERTLNSTHLRAYLKRLPDFDDLEAEERAMSYALRFPNVHQALAFLVSWPALDKAAALVIERFAELDGDHYEILSPAADALAAKHPLAATLLLRAMIEFALKENRVKRYRHAARHLAECASLAVAVGDFGNFEPHKRYGTRLKTEYGRKTSFWALIS